MSTQPDSLPACGYDCYECNCDLAERICDLCGSVAHQLVDGVCRDCVRRLGLDDAGVLPVEHIEIRDVAGLPVASVEPIPQELIDELIEATPTPDCTRQLAASVRDNLQEFFEIDQQTYEHIITEALFQAAQTLKRGETVELEYLGHLYPVCQSVIRYEANPELKRSISTPAQAHDKTLINRIVEQAE